MSACIDRPWLTLAIDVASRMVTGFYVSLDPPSTVSVAMALIQAVLPKDLWLCDRELDLAWPACGLPELLHLDNAPEFKSEALERGTQEYGIKLLYRPTGRPHFGGHIERLIGTVTGAVHLLPGTTFANVTRKGNYQSDKAAALTLPELERWLALQIAGVYHHTVHSALRQPPAMAWEHGLVRRDIRKTANAFSWIFCHLNVGKFAATELVYFICTTGTIFSVRKPVVPRPANS